jgi:hypothetical protein
MQPVSVQLHLVLCCQRSKPIKVFGRTARMEEGGPEVLAISEVDLQSRRIEDYGYTVLLRRFGHQARSATSSQPRPNVASKRNISEVWSRGFESPLSMPKQGGRPVQVKAALAASGNREILKDFGL